MATLREIKKKIHSVENVQKITQAMELVAASRFRRQQRIIEDMNPYEEKLEEILDTLVAGMKVLKHPLVKKRKVQKTALVIFSSDRGLCGAYNQNIFNKAAKFLKTYPSKEFEVILVGKKACEYFKTRKWEIDQEIKDWGGKITWEETREFAQLLIYRFLVEEVDEVWLLYTEHQGVLKRTIKLEKLLNMDICAPEEPVEDRDLIIEPDSVEIFEDILPRVCIAKVFEAFNEAYASELGARVLSMQSATSNAKEMIKKLTVTKNKLRQRGITREMIEISSGAESLKQEL